MFRVDVAAYCDEVIEAKAMIVDWYQVKLFTEHASGIDMDTAHVLFGVVVLLAAAFVFRMPASRRLPWLSVLALELINEWNDLRVEQWPDRGMQYGEGVKDILLTMFLPTLILAVARFRPWLLVDPAKPTSPIGRKAD